jgi:hypothetical protein
LQVEGKIVTVTGGVLEQVYVVTKVPVVIRFGIVIDFEYSFINENVERVISVVSGLITSVQAWVVSNIDSALNATIKESHVSDEHSIGLVASVGIFMRYP